MIEKKQIRRLNLITGPSGAGKSVFCKRQPDWDHCLLNLDDFARVLGDVGDHAVRSQAWQTLVAVLHKRMERGDPVICIDSVFGTQDFADVFEIVRDAPYEYEIAMWVIAPANPDICSERIRQRKQTGGHGHPEMAAELYESSLHAASEYSLYCDHTFLIDSGQALSMVGYLRQYQLDPLDEMSGLPSWVTDHFPVYEGERSSFEVPEEDLARVPIPEDNIESGGGAAPPMG